ncbi:MAG: galactose-1-phosphate uridylyltransferase [Candidatus Melainabacteria bacterium]|nr:galactose-1-phosphate uridylyltransferase [Candidatus Melainabacteria bacterium]
MATIENKHMSEMRWNPVMGEWVVTATHRQDRTFLPPAGYCPLCPTAEGGFPTEVPEAEYEFVVFENKFPSLKKDPAEPEIEGSDLYPVRPSLGICEVVLYSSDHTGTLADLSAKKMAELVRVWRDRYEELGAREDIDYVFIFENKGEAIGVTIHHPHGQIYAFSYLPPRIETELRNEADHHQKTGHCLHCDILQGELSERKRIVVESVHFVAFIPFYARYPYEVHLYAKAHRGSMSDFSSAEEEDLAVILKELLKKYDGLWGFSMPYMMVMHQKPTDGKAYPGCHFHIEFYPPLRTPEKLKYLAGCESGAGTFVNDTLPEVKAEELRAVEV